jgi:acetolactate synthase-1/2/3 large subunit
MRDDRVRVADYLFRRIAELGVRHVFMVSGGGAMHLDDALGAADGLAYVCNLHEQASAMAAESYAKAGGGLGVCLVTTGPGGTNAITGVAGAWLDSTPCLFLSGQVKRADVAGGSGLRQRGVQEVDIVALVRPITKHAVTVLDPGSIRRDLERAVHLARAGRPGPVWLDLPLDVQGALVDPDRLPGFDPPPPAADALLATQVEEVAGLLERAERPVLLLGNGVRLAGAAALVGGLVDALGIPVLTTWQSHDLVPDDHPLLVGRPGALAPRAANFAVQNADLLLAVGARLDLILTGYAPERFAPAAQRVVVDVDPAELAKLEGVADLAVQADAGRFLELLLGRCGAPPRADRRRAWLARCREWKRRYPVVLPEHRALRGAVSTYVLADALSDALGPGDVVATGSSGLGLELFLLAYRASAGQRVLHTAALGAMGNDLPAAIGACLGSGGRRTVCVTGDGGLQVNVQELETIRRLALPVKLFVLNNQGYASIRASQLRHFGRLAGADATSGVTLPPLAGIAAAYRLPYERIDDHEALHRRLPALLARPGPVVCEVNSPADEPRAPSIASTRRPDGTMTSGDLEDLWPFLDRDELQANLTLPAVQRGTTVSRG